jgi:DNA-binding MarR family transcriptional regulator
MAATRLSRRQKRLLHWLDAEYQRTNGGRANSHQELVRLRSHDKGNISRSRRAMEKQGWIAIGRSPGGQAEHVIITPAGRNRVAKVIYVVKKDGYTKNKRL